MRTPSALALVVANLLPLYLVITGQWSLAQILLLFWLENVIIGLLNIVKLLTCTDGGWWGLPKKLFTSAFFTFHYGMFTLGHGMMIINLFAEQQLPGGVDFSPVIVPFTIQHFELWWAGLALFVSHLVSLISNYYMGGEYQRLTTGELMAKPYARVVILHVTVLIGGIIAQALGQPLVALLVLVVLKIVVDVLAHQREHWPKDISSSLYNKSRVK